MLTESFSPQGDKIAIGTNTPSDDVAHGLGQLAEARAFDYHKAALVWDFPSEESLKRLTVAAEDVKEIRYSDHYPIDEKRSSRADSAPSCCLF